MIGTDLESIECSWDAEFGERICGDTFIVFQVDSDCDNVALIRDKRLEGVFNVRRNSIDIIESHNRNWCESLRRTIADGRKSRIGLKRSRVELCDNLNFRYRSWKLSEVDSIHDREIKSGWEF